MVQKLLEEHKLGGYIAGLVLRIPLQKDAYEAVTQAAKMANDFSLSMSLHLRLGGENPAIENCDDQVIANRIVSALVSAKAHSNISVFVDTFADNDRGYFVKNGAVDRRYNPRLSARVIKHLYSHLKDIEHLNKLTQENTTNGQLLSFDGNGDFYVLVLPSQPMYLKYLVLAAPLQVNSAKVINLDDGEIQNMEYQQELNHLNLTNQYLYNVPTLLKFRVK